MGWSGPGSWQVPGFAGLAVAIMAHRTDSGPERRNMMDRWVLHVLFLCRSRVILTRPVEDCNPDRHFPGNLLWDSSLKPTHLQIMITRPVQCGPGRPRSKLF